ncbi:chitin synthase-domain-containing protein [Xylariales sp. PMI_506]|nr:chitin synthase-domain-containing protein [Xylariales sp. PMI_506]
MSQKGTSTATPARPIQSKDVRPEQQKVKVQKYLMIGFVFSANFILIFSSWYWPQYYYIYLPFISLPLVLNCIMIFLIIIYSLKNQVFRPKRTIPAAPENMVLLMPCYNETFEECTRSLDSLVGQVNVDQHRKAIMIVCDGKVRGPGMTKTTAQYLADDILAGASTERMFLRSAYLAWDGQLMDVECIKGVYKGVPFYCIIKQQNQGKRDSLILSRSFVYNFNRRAERPKVIFAPPFFHCMADWLQNDVGFDRCDILIGMDADTVFENDCISELIRESHYPHTVGVCGYVAVDFQHGNWNFWSIYQSAEYTIAQALRRLHQSIVTHKVSCLPGCCQLLKVCDETCGDRVLIDLFGYHPKPGDGMIRRIRATASEDRNHVCLMLMESASAQTRQALRARAYTDVPHSVKVFLSQRRRWTLGATSNDMMLFLRAPLFRFNLWERVVAFSNVLTWILNPFVIASLGCMIYAFLHQPVWIILVFASIMIIPLVYYLIMVAWMPRNALERCQFLAGLLVFTLGGPFINIGVTVYALCNMDNFGWGKTRKVIAEMGAAAEVKEEQSQYQPGVEAPINNDNEKTFGRRVADEENQLREGSSRTPFIAEPLEPRG